MLLRLAIRRLMMAVPLALGASLLAFSILYLVPGDPVTVMLGDRAGDKALAARLRAELHLDEPFLWRYGRFLGGLARGDLGRSLRTGRPVAGDLGEALPASAELALAALAVSLVLGIGAGLVGAFRPRTVLDGALSGIALVGVSVPVFALALGLAWLLAFRFPVFELAGRLGGDWSAYQPRSGLALGDALWYRDGSLAANALAHLALPALTLGLAGSALLARMTRGAVLEAKSQDYARTALAKGLPPWRVFAHVVRNALLPIVTVTGIQFGSLLGGAIVTEEIFAWPGVGTYLVQAIRYRDMVAVQGGVMAVVLLFLVVNLVVDVLYLVIDPRAREGEP